MAPADQRRLDAGGAAARGATGARGRPARARLHRAVLERHSDGVDDSRRQLRTPSGVVSVSPRRAAARVLPAVRVERHDRDHRLGIFRIGDSRRLRHRSQADRGGAAWRGRVVQWRPVERRRVAGGCVAAVRAACRRSARAAQSADGRRRGARGAAPHARVVVAVARAGGCGSGRRRRDSRAGCRRRRARRGRRAGHGDGRCAAGALSRRGRARVSVALRGLRPAEPRSDGRRHAGSGVKRGVNARGGRRCRPAARPAPLERLGRCVRGAGA